MSSEKKTTPHQQPQTFGLLAEYADEGHLIKAARAVRDKGFTRWDSYSPFPVHGIDPAMGIRATRLPWITLCAGIIGLATATLMQWWMNAVDYPWIVSGKPVWSIPANIPIMFELTVLFSALTTFFSMLVLNGLPRHSSPLDRVRRFARVTDDRFFIVIETIDPKYDTADVTRLLEETGAVAVEAVPADTSSDKIPMGLVYGLLIVAAASLIPFGFFASARQSKSEKPAFHVVPDMDFQQKYKAQGDNGFFVDGRAMRLPVAGTVPVGGLRTDTHFFEGKVDGTWALALPDQVPANEATMARGAERFGIYCTPCHGLTGDGDGMVHRRAFALKEGTWVKPTNISEEAVQKKPAGELFDVISNGIRNMPPYAAQIEPADRWAIVLYMRALQRSQAEFAAVAPGASPAATP